jgi:DNA-binding NarL/FixJ family response regulator
VRSVLLVASELMMAVRLEGMLRAVGCPVTVSDPDEDAVRRAIAQARPAVIVLDLLVPPAAVAAVFGSPDAAVIAFGPHTDTARLAAGRAAGAAEVLHRSALQHALVPLVAKHLARSRQDMPDPDPA